MSISQPFSQAYSDGFMPPSPDHSSLGETSIEEDSGNTALEPVDIEALAKRLFSIDHLKLILVNPVFFARFRSFLTVYRPQLAQSLRRYLDVQKALAAIKYANALADNLWPGLEATWLNNEFELRMGTAFDNLVNDALPGYVTYRMTELVTEIMIKDITGRPLPTLKGLVNGLAEVYCLTDPYIPDNPITHASEEFFRTTQYDQKYVIGKNCRFLQGAQTAPSSIARMIEALSTGQEICETVMNYRRDGTPFVNLLLVAPLYDAENKVRYFLGAQIDINGLIAGGTGLESFATLLAQDKSYADSSGPFNHPTVAAIGELGDLLNDNERRAINRGAATRRPSAVNIKGQPAPNSHGHRKMFGMYEPEEPQLWPAAHLGPNGRLPGVFQHYVLVSPYPALRIVFTSPDLRDQKLVQTRFLDRIRGPQHVRQSIKSALSYGQSFTAKISWLPHLPTSPSETSDPGLETIREAVPQELPKRSGPIRTSSTRRTDELQSKRGWIHCTPMLGPESKVGLWMVVMIKAEGMADVNGELNFQKKEAKTDKDRWSG